MTKTGLCDKKKRYLAAASGLGIVGTLLLVGLLTDLPKSGKNFETFLSGERNLAAKTETDDAFIGFASKYKKEYKSSSDYNQRKRQFQINFEAIQDSNSKRRQGNGRDDDDDTLVLGVNQFTDMSAEEYAALLTFKAGPDASSTDQSRNLQAVQ